MAAAQTSRHHDCIRNSGKRKAHCQPRGQVRLRRCCLRQPLLQLCSPVLCMPRNAGFIPV